MAERVDLEQALALLDTYHRQIEALTRQLNFLQAVLGETVQAREALEGLRKEDQADVLVPVGGNTFLEARVTQKQRVLSGIGAGLSIQKPWSEAESGLAKREGQIREELQHVSEAVVRLQQEAATLEEELQADAAASREDGPERPAR